MSKLFSFLLFTTLACLLRLASLSNLTTHYIGGSEGDSALYIWLSRHAFPFLFDRPWFTTNAFYPYDFTLAWSDNYIFPSLLFNCLRIIGFNEPLSYNFLLLTALSLNGFATFLLLKELKLAPVPSLIGGAAFQSFAFLTFHSGHPQLQWAFFVPLSTILLLRFLDTNSLKCLLFTGLLTIASLCTSVYYAVFFVLISLIILGLHKNSPKILELRSLLILFFIFSLALPFLIPYMAVENTFDSRGLHEAFAFKATPLSYLSAPATSFLYSALAPLSHSEAHLFPGLIVVLLSFIAIITSSVSALIFLLVSTLIALAYSSSLATLLVLVIYRIKYVAKLGFPISFLTASLFILFFISLGPTSPKLEESSFLNLYDLLYAIMPGFNGLRAISRIGIVCSLCLASLAAFALSNPLVQKHKILLGLIPLMIIFENYQTVYPLQPIGPKTELITEFEKLSKASEVAISLPLTSKLKSDYSPQSWTNFANKNLEFLLSLSRTDIFVVNGYSGLRPALHRDLLKNLKNFPDSRSHRALIQIAGMKWILYRGGEIENFNLLAFKDKLKGRYSIIREFPNSDLLLELSGEISLHAKSRLRAPAFLSARVELPIKGVVKDLYVDDGMGRNIPASFKEGLIDFDISEQRALSSHPLIIDIGSLDEIGVSTIH